MKHANRVGNMPLGEHDRIFVIMYSDDGDYHRNTISVHDFDATLSGDLVKGETSSSTSFEPPRRMRQGKERVFSEKFEEKSFAMTKWKMAGMEPREKNMYEGMEREPNKMVEMLEHFCPEDQAVLFLGKSHAATVWELLKNRGDAVYARRKRKDEILLRGYHKARPEAEVLFIDRLEQMYFNDNVGVFDMNAYATCFDEGQRLCQDDFDEESDNDTLGAALVSELQCWHDSTSTSVVTEQLTAAQDGVLSTHETSTRLFKQPSMVDPSHANFQAGLQFVAPIESMGSITPTAVSLPPASASSQNLSAEALANALGQLLPNIDELLLQNVSQMIRSQTVHVQRNAPISVNKEVDTNEGHGEGEENEKRGDDENRRVGEERGMENGNNKIKDEDRMPQANCEMEVDTLGGNVDNLQCKIVLQGTSPSNARNITNKEDVETFPANRECVSPLLAPHAALTSELHHSREEDAGHLVLQGNGHAKGTQNDSNSEGKLEI
ncbi:hypothetical protein CBR_g36695 [Chara braunii]|uniref:Uncharacterized protein n=1 Tax=Chara braunii TaxID=69332 RepID=A0A388LLA7_CHABU|nr:hypothetical protein CBR_g36695 [Chara braunii]|eukprot:GBG83077.1 hypothetical protein CBR_g36695 [Chara braunii]